MNKRFGAIPGMTSSVDYNQLSATFTGVLIGLSTIVLYVAAKLGVTLTSGQWEGFVVAVGNLILVLGPALSALTIVFGLVRKGAIALYDKWFPRS